MIERRNRWDTLRHPAHELTEWHPDGTARLIWHFGSARSRELDFNSLSQFSHVNIDVEIDIADAGL
jgi:hypothetical protein